VPPAASDDESFRTYSTAGLSGLVILDEFVNAPVMAALGPTICAQSAQVRFGIEALLARYPAAIKAQAARVRFAVLTLSAQVRPAMEALFAEVAPAIEATGARVVCC
jgi:hypothetical protein